MDKKTVAIVKYETPVESARKVITLCGGLNHLPANAHVFIKPNIVFWTKAVAFPKWGVITTSRLIEDMVILLKEHGVEHITIGEGIVTGDPKDRETPAHAFKTLGYEALNKRYGVNFINVFDRPFEKVDLGGGVELKFNTDILHSDFVVDMPVMKAHNQTVVSLGIKNLKGTIDVNSRKKCHSEDPEKDLNYMISRLADKMPPMLTLIDGIYSNERGPAFDGRMHRSNLLVASPDFLSADLVGANVLGYTADQVPHLVHAAANHNRPLDLSDIEVKGETIESVARFHQHNFEYAQAEDGSWMPLPLAKQGIQGVSYRKYDLSMCTYCSGINGLILTAIRYAWQGKPFDKVEVLTGKHMEPTPGMNKTILMGKCIYQKHKNNPAIKEMFSVKGCPPKAEDVVKAFHEAGIPVDKNMFDNMDQLPGFFMSRYEGKPEFDEGYFRVAE